MTTKTSRKKKKTKLGQEIIAALNECIAYMETQKSVPALAWLRAYGALEKDDGFYEELVDEFDKLERKYLRLLAKTSK